MSIKLEVKALRLKLGHAYARNEELVKKIERLGREVTSMRYEHAIWEKHSLCEIVKERDRFRRALEEIAAQPDVNILAAWSHQRARAALREKA